ncbi:MAG: spermidine synthase [Myxococcota bacterium]
MSRGNSRSRRSQPRVFVRDSRHGRELVVDGTFASFYRPGEVSTGSVWDAIAAPLLALPPKRRRRVLLLGLGGGSAARIVRAVAPGCEIVGVELDADVIEAARRDFGLDELGIELVHDDARSFLERDRGRYDLVLEDVFVGFGDDVHKPDWLPRPGLALAAERLRPRGLLVSNTLDETRSVERELARLFPSVLAIGVEDYDNRILVGGGVEGGEALDARALRAEVRDHPVLAPTLPRLRFRTLR